PAAQDLDATEAVARFVAAGVVRRRGAPARRGRCVVHRQATRGAAGGAAGARDRGGGPPVGEVGRPDDRQPLAHPGHPVALERGQGPVVRTAASRTGARGRVRPHGGHALPAHRAVQALAARPRSRVVRLRPAGGAGELRPRGGAERQPRPGVTSGHPARRWPMTYTVVLLVEKPLTPPDAAQVRALHAELDEPLTYHVLMPVED